MECLGCKRIFKSKGALNSHKRFCSDWKNLGLHIRKNVLPLEERKNKKIECPNCNKEFVNVYSISAHKAWCLGLNDYQNRSKETKDKQAWSRGKILKSIDEIFIIGNKNRTGYVKKVLYVLELKEHKCENCGNSEWMGEKICIELHHINGNSLDNRLENLKFLCPNCHSLTENWRGKNKK